jgi:DNA replication protein DnaC
LPPPAPSGKTGLTYGIAQERIGTWIPNGWSGVEFVNVRALLEEQRRRFNRGESKAIDHLLDDHDKLIVLDDLGAERPTEFALETVALIVESLHLSDTPLITTTNYTPSGLADRLGHADRVVGQRIVERLIEDALADRTVAQERDPD